MTETTGGRPVPDTARTTSPDPWKLVFDQLNRIEQNMLTRSEYSAHQARIDDALAEMRRRIDEVQARSLQTTADWRADSIAAHKEFDRELDAIREGIKKDREEKQKESSQRRFTIVMAVFTTVMSLANGVVLMVVTGVFGG